jgi:N-acetylglucosamine malate deacetylase 1
MTLDVLAFGPHPDDIELFCGGVVIRLVQLGYRVGVIDLSRGERASNGTVEERAREATAAAAVMGIISRDNLGLPDTELAPVPAQIASVVGAIRTHRPEIVLAPFHEDRHPDHVAASELVTRAVALARIRNAGSGDAHAVAQLFYYALRHRMTPSFVVDTSMAAEAKARAIACHASQLGPAGLPSLTGLPAAIDARDRYYGSMIGVAHGEPLRSANVLGVVDPIKQIRDNPFVNPQAFE